MDSTDYLTLLKWTVALEAEGEGFKGKEAVAWVIVNRMKAWGQTTARVVWSKYQFSCWLPEYNFITRLEKMPATVMEEAYVAAKAAYEGYGEDPTNGATHYLNEELTKKLRGGSLPSWVHRLTKVATIGQHTFYK